jgi:uncharacterized membrane protein (DUF485 family)
MAGLLDGNAPDTTHDMAAVRANARTGLILFAFYFAAYAAFVLTNAFSPKTMDMQVVSGLNLAVVSGMALIVSAFVLALIYTALCRKPGGGRS